MTSSSPDLSAAFEDRDRRRAPLVEVQTLEIGKVYEIGVDCTVTIITPHHPERILEQGDGIIIQAIYPTHYHLLTIKGGINFSVLPTQEFPIVQESPKPIK